MPRPKDPDRSLQLRVAHRLKAARQRRGWTAEQLAEVVDVQPETNCRYESGRLPISLSQLHRIADALGVRAERLIGGRPLDLSSRDEEILDAWQALDTQGRQLLLAVARRMAGEGVRRPHKKAAS